MKKFAFTILLIVFSATTFFAQVQNKEDYEVYAAILKHTSKGDDTATFVILDKTMNSDGWEGLNKGTHKNFVKRNKTSIKLEANIPINFRYWIAAKEEVSNLLLKGRSDFDKTQEERKAKGLPLYFYPDMETIWRYFNQQYANSWGYYEFSRVGFNSTKNFAKVEVVYQSDGGFRNVYLLQKSKGKWKVIESTGFVWSHG